MKFVSAFCRGAKTLEKLFCREQSQKINLIKPRMKCHTIMKMKTFALILFCLTLTTAFVSASDYHLVATYMEDSDVATGTAALTVYVLVPPDNSSRPIVFKTFDSKIMELRLSQLPRGSVLHFDPDPRSPGVPSAQLEALTSCCKTNEIGFVISNVN